MKVSDLAKELGYESTVLIEKAKAIGVTLKVSRSPVDEPTARKIRALISPAPKKPAPKKPAVKKTTVKKPVKGAKKLATTPAALPAAAQPPEPPPTPAPTPVTATPTAPPKPTPAPAVTLPHSVPHSVPHAVPHAAAPAATPATTPAAAQKPAPAHPTPVKKEEEEKPPATPLIDVDKIVGKEKDIRVLTPHKVDLYSRETTLSEREMRKLRISDKTKLGPKPGMPKTRYKKTWASHQAARPIIPMADRKIDVTAPIAIKDFSQQTGIKANLIIKKLIDMGNLVNINTVIDEETVKLVAVEFKRDITVSRVQTAEETLLKPAAEEKPENLVVRAPVVTFMGHVDHGKTSLLDKIRKTNVAAQESGGITQHIGAYKVQKGDKYVVFLDTPGHEAFTAMRARGANATDVAVIVVAADDGVMPQTEEAINHARAADVAIVVAINKCDKKEANINRVKHQLAQIGLVTEEWGGKTVCVEVSAITGHNVDLLLEMLSLEAEMLELKANPRKPAEGIVLEAKKSDQRGVAATVLIQDGTLHRGDIVLCGKTYGKARYMVDEFNRSLQESPPATPVQLFGLEELPEAGDKLIVMSTLQDARQVAEERRKASRELAITPRVHITLDNIFTHIESGGIKEVHIILKADVKGSIEVLKGSLNKIHAQEVALRIIHSGVGSVNESDVLLADASDAIIIGFHVITEERARSLAKDKGIDIRNYSVIYQIIDDVKAALEGLLEPEKVEEVSGHCRIQEVFKISRAGTVAGCLVTDGKIERSAHVRLVRDGGVIFQGKLESLKRFKDDVREVANGYECGLKIAGYDDIKTNDVIEAYKIKEVARKLVTT